MHNRPASKHPQQKVVDRLNLKVNFYFVIAMFLCRTMRSILDRTLPWRFTNLPNNAKLELCPRSIENQLSNADVKIAFQLPDNQRLTGEFPTTTRLAEIVEHFSAHLQR